MQTHITMSVSTVLVQFSHSALYVMDSFKPKKDENGPYMQKLGYTVI